jgi:cell wall-associated NlpC family hydrolase
MLGGSARARLRAATATLALATAAATGSVVSAPSAHAATASFQQRADRVLHVAFNQRGKPYRYGADGPSAFDCSGLVRYVFQRALGRSLPHNAEAQYRDTQHIRFERNARPGDLVFQVDSGGYAFHVGIYAGHGYFWNAPHSGTVVKKQRMWSGRWRFGRIIR